MRVRWKVLAAEPLLSEEKSPFSSLNGSSAAKIIFPEFAQVSLSADYTLTSWVVRTFSRNILLFLSILRGGTGYINLSTMVTSRIRTPPAPRSNFPIAPCLSEWRLCVKLSAGVVFLLWQAGCETVLQTLGFPDNYMALFPRCSVHSARTAIAQLWRTSSYIASCFQELLSPLLRQYKRPRPRDRHRT